MIQAYHADNGIFKAKKSIEECLQQKQKLTFAGVNAHHQNGIAEQRIRELQETTRAMLIHASKQWPGVVTIHHWPYAMRMANQAYNSRPLSLQTDNQSPNVIFDNSAADQNPNHWKPFGCPAYSRRSSKGQWEYTQNGMPGLEPASTWGSPRSTTEMWL